jgi:hypothetical protein
MAITLTTAFLAELNKNVNQPNTIFEVDLDSATVKWGLSSGGYSGVLPIVKTVSLLQNKIDPKAGHSTRGQIKLTLVGRDNFKSLIQDNYLKNRRVRRYDGFIASGFLYSDYAKTYDGFISDWERDGDELTITVSDDLYDASIKIPEENSTNTQYASYLSSNPVGIMQNILTGQIGIDGAYIDSSQFTSEQNIWYPSWKFSRVITEPEKADDYLNELQEETMSYIIHDGDKITFKAFAPAVPSQTVETWSDSNEILKDSLAQKSGYKDNFYNRVIVYYDYDESGSDSASNFESAVIAIDADSQDATQWDEEKTKTIKSKWIRSLYWAQPSAVTGVVIYHASASNNAGSGTLTFSSANQTLTWTAPSSGAGGDPVTVDDDGKYDLYDGDSTKYIRVIVTAGSLPVSNQAETITLTSINASSVATALAQRLLNLYGDPLSTISLDIDINNCAYSGALIKPTDLKDITTDEACTKGYSSWNAERVMLTSVKPDFEKGKVTIEAMQTRTKRQYGFVAPAGNPHEWESATPAERQYAYVGKCYVW